MSTGGGLLRLGRRPLRRRYGRPVRRPAADPPTGAQDVAIPGVHGETIRGWFLANPAYTLGAPRPAALVMHGWGASAADMLPVAQPLLDSGLHVLLLDAGGHGRSDDVEFSSMPALADDVQIGLIRESSVALRVVERSICHRFDSFAPINTIRRVSAPVLLLHGARDTTIPVTDAYELREHAPPHSSLLVIADADHTTVEALDHVMPALSRFLREAGMAITPPGVSSE